MNCVNTKNPGFEELSSVIGEIPALNVMALNNGNPIDMAPNGNPSKLFNDIEINVGDRNVALAMKAVTYTPQFKEYFGDWQKTAEEMLKAGSILKGILLDKRINSIEAMTLIENMLPNSDNGRYLKELINGMLENADTKTNVIFTMDYDKYYGPEDSYAYYSNSSDMIVINLAGLIEYADEQGYTKEQFAELIGHVFTHELIHHSTNQLINILHEYDELEGSVNKLISYLEEIVLNYSIDENRTKTLKYIIKVLKNNNVKNGNANIAEIKKVIRYIDSTTMMLLHDASIVNVLENDINSIEKRINSLPNSASIYKEISSIIDVLKDNKLFKDEYGITNPAEFLAELSNKDFVDKLSKLPPTNKKKYKNLFEQVIDIIRKILNLDKRRLSDQAFELLSEMVTNNIYEKDASRQIIMMKKPSSYKLDVNGEPKYKYVANYMKLPVDNNSLEDVTNNDLIEANNIIDSYLSNPDNFSVIINNKVNKITRSFYNGYLIDHSLSKILTINSRVKNDIAQKYTTINGEKINLAKSVEQIEDDIANGIPEEEALNNASGRWWLDADNEVHFAPKEDDGVKLKSVALEGLERQKWYINAKINHLMATINKLRNIRNIENKKRIKDKEELLRIKNSIVRLSNELDYFIELSKQVGQLRKNVSVGDSKPAIFANAINEMVDKEIETVKEYISIAKNGDLSAITEAETIINYYQNIADFRTLNENPLFGDTIKTRLASVYEKYNKQINEGNLDNIPEEDAGIAYLAMTLVNASKSFDKLSNELEKIKRETVENEIKKNPLIQKMNNGEDVDIAKMLEDKDDISLMDFLFFNISTNMTSEDTVFAQLMRIEARNAVDREKSKVLDMINKLNTLQSKIEKKLPKKRGFIFRASDYTPFMQKDENGNFTGKIINRYTDRWFRELYRRLYSRPETKKDTVKRNLWIKKNAHAIDLRVIKSSKEKFYDDPRLKKISKVLYGNEEEYKRIMFNISDEDAVKYESILRDRYGKMFDYHVSEAEAKFNDFLDRMEALIDNVDEHPDAKELEELNIMNSKYNPLLVAKVFDVPQISPWFKVSSSGDEMSAEPTYLAFAPKSRNEYFDERFDKIEEDEDMFEYWETLNEAGMYIKESFSENGRDIPVGSIPALRKTLAEVLLDQGSGTGLFKRFKGLKDWAVNGIIENVRTKSMKGVNASDKLGINKNLDASIKDEIVKAVNLKKTVFARLGNEPLTGKVNINQLTTEQVEFLAELIGVNNNREAVAEVLGNEFNPNSIIFSYTRDQVFQKYSMDIPRVFRTGVILAAEYNARLRMYPMLKIMYDMYVNIKRKGRTGDNDGMLSGFVDKMTGRDKVRHQRRLAVKRMEYWFNKSVKGNFNSNVYGVFKGLKNKDYKFDKKQFLTGIARFMATGKIYTGKENEMYKDVTKEILAQLDDLKKVLSSTNADMNAIMEFEKAIRTGKVGDIKKFKEATLIESANTEFVTDVNNMVKNIIDMVLARSELGGNLALSSIVNSLKVVTIFKGLAYNIQSALTNRIEGHITNMLMDASGRYWTPGNMAFANAFINKSYKRWVAPDSDDAKQMMIFHNVLVNYGILQDASNELQKNSVKSSIRNLHKLSPYYLSVTHVETKNQGSVMLSIAMDMKIKDKEGNEHPLFDKKTLKWTAFDIDKDTGEMTLKEEFDTEENRRNWLYMTGDQFSVFKNKVVDANSKEHGDYDPFGGMWIKSQEWGSIMMIFRTWMPARIWTRFAKEQYILEHGNFKGMYRSHTLSTATLAGTIAGAVFGPAFAIVGGTLGAVWALNSGIKSEASAIREIIQFSKATVINMLTLPLRVAGFKINNPTINIKGISDIDATNLAANAAELAMLLSLVLFKMLLKSIDFGDDDKDNPKYRLYLFFENKTMQLVQNFTMFTNPAQFYDSIKSNAFLKNLDAAAKLIDSFEKTFEGNYVFQQGPYKDKNRILVNMQRLFMPGFINWVGFKTYTLDDWTKNDFIDRMFKDDSKKKKKKSSNTKKTSSYYSKNHMRKITRKVKVEEKNK